MTETTTRKEAIERGLIRYFTGKPCSRGHVAERYVSTSQCQECLRGFDKKYYWQNPEKERSKKRLKMQRRRRENRDHHLSLKREWTKKDRLRPHSLLNHRFSRAVLHALKHQKSGRSWEFLVGYSLDELARHIERQFSKGMSWDNIGAWHVDHIIPLRLFRFSSHDDADFKAAWALSNLRPLWACQNASKQGRRTHLL